MNWIVVVDSHVSTLQSAGQILCKQQMRVTGFKSGQALLAFLRNNRPDMILLGNVMWELGGFEAVSTIRREQAHCARVPVLLMKEPDESWEEQAQSMGACGVVSKPLTSAALIPLVLAACEAGGQHEEEEKLSGRTTIIYSI